MFFFFTQILMNAQWIQAHVVQERVWIWTALTGVSAHLATISTRKPVKVQQTNTSPFCIIVNRQVKAWKIKTQISEVIKSLHAGVNLTSGMAENTYLQHGHIHSICIRTLLRCTGREWTISSPPPSLQLPCCYKSPLFPLSHVGVGPSQNTLIVYTVGLMKRYSADFNTFLRCALFLEAGRKSTECSASVTEAAGHCDERTCDTEAIPENMPAFNYPRVRLHSVLITCG